jgi:hypothetical protein
MIFILILILNIFFLFFIKSQKKYWQIPILIWSVLILTFIGWRTYSDTNYQKSENSYWEKTSNIEFNKLNEIKDSIITNNMLFVNIIGFQTFITFVFQNIGFYKTDEKKTYKWTAIIFAILTLTSTILLILIGIVPSSGILG